MAEVQRPNIAPQPKSEHDKLSGRAWWDSIGKPKYVVAPMVDQSELAWRILSRVHGATLAYTPMFHAGLFGSPEHPRYSEDHFDTSPGSIEGVAPYDRPLVVQFCANEKDTWLAAARKVVDRCDAVDLNLGCPQGIARKGRFGAFLMEEWDLIQGMITHLHTHLSIPVIAKLRVFPALDRTLEYASHVYSSGAQLVTIHGRTREAKGRLAGFASWPKIKAVTDMLSSRVPVLANGGVPSAEEVEPCMQETGTDGIMSAEGNLYNPMIFSPSNAAGGRAYRACLPETMRAALDACDAQLVGEWDKDKAAYAPATYLANQYLVIVKTLPSTKTALSAVKAHLFKLFRPVWAAEHHLDLREKLGRAGSGKGVDYAERVAQYQNFVDEMHARLQADLANGLLPANTNRPLTHAEVLRDFAGVIPYSHAQPYLRVQSVDAPMNDETTSELAVGKRVRAEAEGKQEQTVGSPLTAIDTDAPADKKIKIDAPDVDATAPAPSKSFKTIPCISSARESNPCVNSAAVKCSHGACSACCGNGAEGGVEMCEFHSSKRDKEAEKRQGKRAARKSRKEQATGQPEKVSGQEAAILPG